MSEIAFVRGGARALVGLVAALVMAVAWGCGSSGGDKGASRSAAAHAAVERGALLVDVRTPSEFESGHVAGAMNVPVDTLEARIGEITPGREVVVYCRSGKRSAKAAAILGARGYSVIDLGPMEAW